ncbi:hypothetical protein FHX74_001273 [Friedmanniella endophytica]|uniref:HD domain-containing protein n=1 Tax=Microlunatus kandeliicorticis TaxID=1759536 RepID=A0A7W3IR36_9ACTN|nr:HD domain-containing protein [Microlunatus kandeliicorticis]MBA8793668.1 hypothetical protein [Microlunatus kandeliicorticis]
MLESRWAYECARGYLAPLGRRWSHVRAVGAVAEKLAPAFGGGFDLLVDAALLHDIGYSASLATSGFHPADGARFLEACGEHQLALLVAHHSGARIEAALRGIDGYCDEFPWCNTALDKALTFCDLTTSPSGEPMSLHERVAEILDRYGADHVVARSIHSGLPEFEEACAATAALIEVAGIEVEPARLAGLDRVAV